MCGSSPHTRGALRVERELDRRGRIIPAYAGSTAPTARLHRRNADHPRIRGEHVQMNRAIADGSGSSPHTRGAQHVQQSPHRRAGIIPAYAGSTRTGAGGTRRSGDHPRIRGEHDSRQSTSSGNRGSSPHTRGAPANDFVMVQEDRIIPAYAGSTAPRASAIRHFSDHPRIRGEHRRLRYGDRAGTGSSPHTRGAHAALDVEGLAARIIPAYAGSTASLRFDPCWDWDHPRIRGEHIDCATHGA